MIKNTITLTLLFSVILMSCKKR